MGTKLSTWLIKVSQSWILILTLLILGAVYPQILLFSMDPKI